MAGEADADLFPTFHTLGQPEPGGKYRVIKSVYRPLSIQEGPPSNSNLHLQVVECESREVRGHMS